MARTRTSDQTLRRQHAKLLVYAYLLASGAIQAAAAAAEAPAQPARRNDVPCITCQVLSVRPDQVAGLPPSLAGVRVALRVPAVGEPDGWQAALAELTRRQATVGLHVAGVPSGEDLRLTAAVDLLILEPDAAALGDLDRLAFDL